jgi:hypothetical protein
MMKTVSALSVLAFAVQCSSKAIGSTTQQLLHFQHGQGDLIET